MNEILVAITMDCERPRSETEKQASGPPDYRTSEAWIRGYAAIAREFGFPVSFFIHPEVAAPHADLFGELERDGACLGLHLHPWKFADRHYNAHFGALTAGQQAAILSEAVAVWSHALGKRPLYFRPGTFSANDATFPVLSELGFRGGSISAPGRFFPDFYAIWTGAPYDPHRAHPAFRMREGSLDFADIPLTVDASRTIEANGNRVHWDLRPDYREADYALIAGNIVAQIVARDPAVPVINLVTHNDNDYTDPDDPVCRNFRTVLRAVTDACRAAGRHAVGTTVGAICDKVLAMAAAPPHLETGALFQKHRRKGEALG